MLLELRSRIYFRNLWCESSHREFTSKILGNAENFTLLFDCVYFKVYLEFYRKSIVTVEQRQLRRAL